MKMQKPDNQFNDRDEALEAPADLVSALRQLPREEIFVPPTIDEGLLRAARQHLSPAERPRITWWRWVPWASGAAAALVLLVLVLQSPRPGPAFAREDLNRDGIVDILDAFALAKQLETGAASQANIDLTGDGTIDQRDVAALAAHAVALEKGGPS